MARVPGTSGWLGLRSPFPVARLWDDLDDTRLPGDDPIDLHARRSLGDSGKASPEPVDSRDGKPPQGSTETKLIGRSGWFLPTDLVAYTVAAVGTRGRAAAGALARLAYQTTVTPVQARGIRPQIGLGSGRPQLDACTTHGTYHA
jgi:hypothetical protein